MTDFELTADILNLYEGYDLDRLSEGFNADLEVLDDNEAEEVLGPLAKSRNSVQVVRFDSQQYALLKRYTEGDYDISPRERAKNEVRVLHNIRKNGFTSCPRLLSTKVAHDNERNPVTATEYLPDLYPTSSLRPEIVDELLSGNDDMPTAEGPFSLIESFHRKAKYIHRDAHLGNFGLRQNADSPEDQWVLLDFENAESIADYPLEYTWDLREGDIVDLAADIMVAVAQEKGEERIADSIDGIKKCIDKRYLQYTKDNVDLDDLLSKSKEKAFEIIEEKKFSGEYY